MTNNNLIELRTLLDKASPDDRANLQKIIGAGFGDSPELLCDHIQFLRAGVMGQFLDNRDYKQLVTDIADHIQIDWSGLIRGRRWTDLSAAEIEDAIVVGTLQKLFAQLSDQDRRLLAEELGKEAQDPSIVGKLLLSGGAIVLIGWMLLGVSVLLNLSQTNWSRLVPGIVYISYIRHKVDSVK